jgi:hypothetical protein
MYWLEENAEALFAIRAALLSDRWETMLKAVQRSMSRDPRLTWRWSAPTANTDAPPVATLPSPQTPSQTDLADIATCHVLGSDPLYTVAAKQPEMLKWADGRASFGVVPDFVKDEWGIDLGSG